MSRTLRMRTTAAAAFLAAVAHACGGGGSGGPQGPDRSVASVVVSPSIATVDEGLSTQFTATAFSASGQPLAGVTFEWEVTNSGVAEVDATGRATGRAAGQVQVRATANAKTGSAQLTVVVRPFIAGVAPGQIAEGQPATVSGRGFSTLAVANRVTIGGVDATVTSSTATALQIIVPACLPAGSIPVQVTVGTTSSNVVQAPHQPPSGSLQLAVGQQTILTGAGNPCLRFAASAAFEEYMIGIQSTVEEPTALIGVRVGSAAAAAAGDRAPALLVPAAGTPGRLVPSAESGIDERLERHRAAEARFRSREAGLLRSGRMPLSAARSAFGRRSLAPADVPDVGDRFDIRVPDLLINSCTNFAPITVEVVHVGQRAVWLADIENPAGGFTAADYEEMGRLFDDDVHPVLTDYFGEPSDIDANGRISVVLTKELNRTLEQTDVLAFVAFSNFFPVETCAASNLGEYFFSLVADPDATFGPGVTLQDASDLLPILIAHEPTHIIQFGRRLMFPGAEDLPAVWIMEGQATLAEEVVGFHVDGRVAGQNYGGDVLFDEASAGWYPDAFFGLFQYFGFVSREIRAPGAPEQCSFLGAEGPCGVGPIYGGAWSFLRWTSDQFGPGLGGEQRIHRTILDNTGTGLQMIAGIVGVPVETLLAQWAASLYVDDRVAGADPRLQWTSWNLFSIEQAVVPTAHLAPYHRGFTSFAENLTIRGGSSAYVRVSGTAHPASAVGIRSLSGAPLPSSIQVWVVRIR